MKFRFVKLNRFKLAIPLNAAELVRPGLAERKPQADSGRPNRQLKMHNTAKGEDLAIRVTLANVRMFRQRLFA